MLSSIYINNHNEGTDYPSDGGYLWLSIRSKYYARQPT